MTTTPLPAALARSLGMLMTNIGLNETQLAQQTGISQSVLNKLLSGKTRNPKIATLLPISQFFNLSINQLMDDAAVAKTLTEHTEAHPDPREAPILTLPQVLDWLNNPSTKTQLQLPSITIHSNTSIDHRCFAIILEDTTMEPRFPKHTLCIIAPHDTPHDQDFVIAHVLGTQDVTFKQYLTDGNQRYLKPINQHFQLTPITPQHRILGIMIQARINRTPYGLR